MTVDFMMNQLILSIFINFFRYCGAAFFSKIPLTCMLQFFLPPSLRLDLLSLHVVAIGTTN